MTTIEDQTTKLTMLLSAGILTFVGTKASYDIAWKHAESLEEYTSWIVSNQALPMFASTMSSILYILLICLRKDETSKAFQALSKFAKSIQPTYNLLQTVFNTWLAVAFLRWPLWGDVSPVWDSHLACIYWLYYANKIVDCLDTVFIQLSSRKQLSVLHCVHHFGQIWFVHFILAVFPAGDAWFPPFLNSAVHAFMYAWYYAAAASKDYPFLGPFVRAVKPGLTISQMTQFVLIMVHNWKVYRLQSTPQSIAVVSFVWMIILLGLFGNFYVQTYNKKKPVSSQSSGKASPMKSAPVHTSSRKL